MRVSPRLTGCRRRVPGPRRRLRRRRRAGGSVPGRPPGHRRRRRRRRRAGRQRRGLLRSKDLSRIVLKGRDGSRVRAARRRALHVRRALARGRAEDARRLAALRGERPAYVRNPFEAKAAVAAQIEQLEARLGVEGVRRPRLRSNAAPRGPPWTATPPALLQSGPSGPPPPMTMDDVAARLRGAKKIVVMCGAGISVSPGFPTSAHQAPGCTTSRRTACRSPRRSSTLASSSTTRSPSTIWRRRCGRATSTRRRPTASSSCSTTAASSSASSKTSTLEAAAGLPPAQIVAAHGNSTAPVAHRFDGGGDGGPVDVALRDAIMAGEEGPGGGARSAQRTANSPSRASPSSARRCRSG